MYLQYVSLGRISLRDIWVVSYRLGGPARVWVPSQAGRCEQLKTIVMVTGNTKGYEEAGICCE